MSSSTSKKILGFVVLLIILGIALVLRDGAQKRLADRQESTPPSNDQPAADDKRILITLENQNQFTQGDNGCNEQFNGDPANTKVTYTNQDKGISMQLPYNSAWGNDKYRITPFEEDFTVREDGPNRTIQGVIYYGHLTPFEGCGWARTQLVRLLPVKTVAQTINELNQSPTADMITQKPMAIRINDLDIVRYTSDGLCTYPTLIVIGQKYNYEFSPLCSDEFGPLEEVIKTIKLIE